MSIIQEALKRAQYDYAAKKGLPQAHEESGREWTIPTTVKALYAPGMIRKIAIALYVVVLLALITGFGIRALFSRLVAIDGGRIPNNTMVSGNNTHAADAKAVKQSPDLVLNGIMYTEENPKAIINGVVVREGDVVSSATVVSISERNVLLKYNNDDNQVEVALKLKD